MTTLLDDIAEEEFGGDGLLARNARSLSDPITSPLRPASEQLHVAFDDPGRILLDGVPLNADVTGAVIDGRIRRTIEGASQLDLTLHDKARNLVKSALLNHRVNVEVEGHFFTLLSSSKAGDDFPLVFEDRAVADMRRYTKFRKAVRGKVTRAEFARMLVREVRPHRLKFYCPSLHKELPIAEPRGDRREADRQRRRGLPRRRDGAGIPRGVRGLTVKGQAATDSQIHIAEIALDVAERLKAPVRARTALIMALVQESQMANLMGGSGSSVGVLQLIDTWGSVESRRKITRVVEMFLTRGFTGRGGAIALAKQGMSPAAICGAVQGNAGGAGDYAPWLSEAQEWVRAYEGGGGEVDVNDQNTTITRTIHKPYEFTRGQDGKRENTWACLLRLAEDIKWRRFVVGETVYFISERELFESRPRMRISEDDPAIDYIDYEIHERKIAKELTVKCRANRWSAPPGAIIVVEDEGPSEGRWLVSTVERGLYNADTSITLKKPRRDLPEPPQETSKKTIQIPRGGGGAGGPGEGRPGQKTRINRFEGAKQIVDDLARIVMDVDPEHLYVGSAYRPGDPKDHGGNDSYKAARDIGYRGVDLLKGPPHPSLNKGCVALGKALGRNYGNGTRGPFQQADNVHKHGFRIQVIWQTPRWGGHMGHIHIGVKKGG